MKTLKPIVMGVPGGIVMFLGLVYTVRHPELVVAGVLMTISWSIIVMWVVEHIWDWIAERR